MLGYLLQLSANFTLENIIIIALSALLYFFMEYKSKVGDHSFSFLIWIKDNWYNFIINIIAVLIYFMVVDDVTKVECVVIGLAPNYLVDKIMDLKAKFIDKSR